MTRDVGDSTGVADRPERARERLVIVQARRRIAEGMNEHDRVARVKLPREQNR
ncbi:MAG TPA: hypothetical protein VNI83_10890 [Vicinamibacterales bacterium]|nr:hypothetical protein [Vicinamibacterales bacterium]